MADSEETNRRYRMLWRQAKKSLEAYASSTQSYSGKINSKSSEGPLSQPKSGQKVEIEMDDKTTDDNCIEYIIKVVSSKEKGDQMKQRRVRFKNDVNYH